MMGVANIKAGFANLVVAGGVESMSQAPYLVSGKVRSGVKMGNLEFIDYMVTHGLTWKFGNYHMGITVEHIVVMHRCIREPEADFESHAIVKARKAQENVLYDGDI